MALAIVVMAAGLGTRMKSDTPKVLHKLNGKHVVRHVVDTAASMKPESIVVVINPAGGPVRDALKDCNVAFAIQQEPNGTADALATALKKLGKFTGTLLVLSGDAPLVTIETLKLLIKTHKRRKEEISILSFIVDGDHAYGRIVRNGNDITAIVEARDSDEEQEKIDEVNSGIYAFEPSALALMKEIRINPRKKEFYLTDIVALAFNKGLRIGAYPIGDETELTGINTRAELALAGLYLRDRIVSQWLEAGVSFIDPLSVFIGPNVRIGTDTIIYPNVMIEGSTSIGKSCVVYPNTRISNSKIGNGVSVKDSSVIESAIIKDKATVGPFAHLRPDSVIGNSAKIGNFVEIKKSVIGNGSKASHLSYIGDAEIGDDVNIGAGTITCNYDGVNKFKTVIETGSFIGSDTQLVAPVTVGKGAYVGSGTTVTKDVPPMALALSRSPQINIEGWARKKASAKKTRLK
jgi:bifunctional UDP-N-acetylglucosamine pyrophosphorylase/glucosamine-1-phosphate N-acetyltransferase